MRNSDRNVRERTVVDGKQGPGNGNGASNITLGRGESVGGRGRFQRQAEKRVRLMQRIRLAMTYRAKKTKTLVKTPALWVRASTPNASKAVKRTRTVVQPCHREKGRWIQTENRLVRHAL